MGLKGKDRAKGDFLRRAVEEEAHGGPPNFELYLAIVQITQTGGGYGGYPPYREGVGVKELII